MRDRQASRDRWRSLSQREYKRSNGSRKIISLVVMLVLIVVCIYQLNDPNTFGPVLRAIGLAPSLQPPNSDPAQTTHTIAESVVERPMHEIEALADVWQAILKDTAEDQLKSISIRYRSAANTSAEVVNDQVAHNILAVWESIDSQLKRLPELRNGTVDDSGVRSFAAKWKAYRSSQSLDLPDDLLNSLRLALARTSKHGQLAD